MCWEILVKVSMKDTLVYFLTIKLIWFLCGILLAFVNFSNEILLNTILLLGVKVFLDLILTFLLSGAYNVILGKLGAKENIEFSVRTLIFAETPSSLFFFLPILSSIWTMILIFIGLKYMYKTSYTKVILAELMGSTLIYGGFFLILNIVFESSNITLFYV